MYTIKLIHWTNMQLSNLVDPFDKDHKQINQTMFFNQTKFNYVIRNDRNIIR